MKLEPAMECLYRADLYRLLALALDTPTATTRELLGEVISEWPSFDGESAVLEALKQLTPHIPVDLDEWECEYNRLFVTHMACPPYEGNYHLVERGPVLGDIAAFYTAFGMVMGETAGPPDAIWAELGFMHVMAMKELYAMENGMIEEEDVTRQAQKDFLNDHLGRWGSALASRIKAETHLPFLRQCANVLAVWIKRECDRYALSPVPVSVPLPMADDEPPKCAMEQ